MVEVDGRTDARLGEAELELTTSRSSRPVRRWMVGGRWSMIVSDYIAGDGLMVCRAPQRPCRAPYVAFGDLRDKDEPSPIEDVSNVGRRRFRDHAVQARRP